MEAKALESGRQDRCTKRILHACDKFVTLFVVAPLVVTHWYGTWQFMDRNPEYFPPVPALLVGVLWHLIASVARNDIHEKLKPTEGSTATSQRTLRFLIVKFYLYIFSIACIMQWRSMFVLMNIYVGKATCVGRIGQTFKDIFVLRDGDLADSYSSCNRLHSARLPEVCPQPRRSAVRHHHRLEGSRASVPHTLPMRRKYKRTDSQVQRFADRRAFRIHITKARPRKRYNTTERSRALSRIGDSEPFSSLFFERENHRRRGVRRTLSAALRAIISFELMCDYHQ